MTLSNYLKNTNGTSIVLADVTDYAPSAANAIGTRTVQIDLTSVGNNTARQSDKFSFGATRAPLWGISAVLEWPSAPTAGNVVNFWLALSHSSTAGYGNPGGVSGADSAYAGYSSNLSASLPQLMHIGTFRCTAQTLQIQRGFGEFTPLLQYGTLIVENQSAVGFHTDAVEMAIALEPLDYPAEN